MVSLSLQALRAGGRIGVLCQHGKVLARLEITRGPKSAASSKVTAKDVEGQEPPRDFTTINLLGAPWAPRYMVGAPAIAPTLRAFRRAGATGACDCTIDSPPLPEEEAQPTM